MAKQTHSKQDKNCPVCGGKTVASVAPGGSVQAAINSTKCTCEVIIYLPNNQGLHLPLSAARKTSRHGDDYEHTDLD